MKRPCLESATRRSVYQFRSHGNRRLRWPPPVSCGLRRYKRLKRHAHRTMPSYLPGMPERSAPRVRTWCKNDAGKRGNPKHYWLPIGCTARQRHLLPPREHHLTRAGGNERKTKVSLCLEKAKLQAILGCPPDRGLIFIVNCMTKETAEDCRLPVYPLPWQGRGQGVRLG